MRHALPELPSPIHAAQYYVQSPTPTYQEQSPHLILVPLVACARVGSPSPNRRVAGGMIRVGPRPKGGGLEQPGSTRSATLAAPSSSRGIGGCRRCLEVGAHVREQPRPLPR